jgi:hypothetical protein
MNGNQDAHLKEYDYKSEQHRRWQNTKSRRLTRKTLIFLFSQFTQSLLTILAMKSAIGQIGKKAAAGSAAGAGVVLAAPPAHARAPPTTAHAPDTLRYKHADEVSLPFSRVTGMPVHLPACAFAYIHVQNTRSCVLYAWCNTGLDADRL